MTWRLAIAAVVSGAVLLGGCGSPATPASEVPQLAQTLTAVDQALIDGQLPQARRQVRQLMATTEAARDAGDLDDAEAERILAAAATLLATLPDGSPEPPSTPEHQPTQGGENDDTGNDLEENRDDEAEEGAAEEGADDESDGGDREKQSGGTKKGPQKPDKAGSDGGNGKGKGKG